MRERVRVRGRLGDRFLSQRGQLLADVGFAPDPGRVEIDERGVTVYHWTAFDRLPRIFGVAGGLWARRRADVSDLTPEFAGAYAVEGLLEPMPSWISESGLFTDVHGELFQDHVMQEVVLRAVLPNEYGHVYVADFAHALECKSLTRRGFAPLGLGYNCSTGHEARRAFANSCISIHEYVGGHVAPVVAIMRSGSGMAVPPQLLAIHLAAALPPTPLPASLDAPVM